MRDEIIERKIISISDQENPHRFITLIRVDISTEDKLLDLQLLISTAYGSDVFVISEIENRKMFKACRQFLKINKRYMGFEYDFLETKKLEQDEFIEQASSIFTINLPSPSSANKVLYTTADDYKLIYEAVRMPYRLNILRKIPYYKGTDVVGMPIRDLQHLNLLTYLEENQFLSNLNFLNSSVLELGPAFGYFYRFAQAKGASHVTILDKNTGFCSLSRCDGADVIEGNLSQEKTLEELKEKMQSVKFDYFFAKGLFNISQFIGNESHYSNVVETISNLINQSGVWGTYNIDRENGITDEQIKFSQDVFLANKWKPLKLEQSICDLIGLNYKPEVDWTLWVLNQK